MSGIKPFSIRKQLVYDAYLKVLSNKGSGGVDGISLSEFDKDYKNHLYKFRGGELAGNLKLLHKPGYHQSCG